MVATLVRGVHVDVTLVKKHAQMKKIAISSKFFIETLADSKNSRTFATAIEKQTMQRKMKDWFLG